MEAGQRGCILLLVVIIFLLPAAAQTRTTATDFDDLLHRGFDFHQRQEYAQALPLLQKARRLRPQEYFVNLLLGIDLLRTGRPAEAVGFLKEAARRRPGEEFPYEYLGEAQATQYNYAAAADAYAGALRVAPQSSQAAVAMVDFSLARFAALSRQLRSSEHGLAAEYRIEALSHSAGDSSRRQLLQRAAALDGDAPGIWSDLALADIAAGDHTTAGQDLREALRRNPNDLHAWEAEAMLAAQSGEWKAAARRLNAIAERSPAMLAQAAAGWPASLQPAESASFSGPAAIFFACVRRRNCPPEALEPKLSPPLRCAGAAPELLFQQQRWECLAESRTAHPLQRATAFARTGRCREAIPLLERGIGSNPIVEPLFLLSICYARQAGDTAARLPPSPSNEAALHLMRGDILLRLRADGAGAAREYESALAAGDREAGLRARLAEAQLASGQTDAARQSAQAALRLEPHSPAAMRTLARLAMQDRAYATALPYLRQLAAREPRDLGTRVELGTACAQTGALAEALSNLSSALDQGYPDEKGSLHYLLGTVLRRMGREAEAEQKFAVARRLSDAFQHTSRQEQNEHP